MLSVLILAGILAVIMSVAAMIIVDDVSSDILFNRKTHRHDPALSVTEAEYVMEEPVIDEITVEEPVAEEITYEPAEIGYSEMQYDSYLEPTEYSESEETYTSAYLRSAGVIEDGERKYTWYSQNVLPGEGLEIEGRHVEDGYVVDGEGRIVVASSDIPYGTEIELPFGSGKGIVLDTGYLESGQIDIYTDF